MHFFHTAQKRAKITLAKVHIAVVRVAEEGRLSAHQKKLFVRALLNKSFIKRVNCEKS